MTIRSVNSLLFFERYGRAHNEHNTHTTTNTILTPPHMHLYMCPFSTHAKFFYKDTRSRRAWTYTFSLNTHVYEYLFIFYLVRCTRFELPESSAAARSPGISLGPPVNLIYALGIHEVTLAKGGSITSH